MSESTVYWTKANFNSEINGKQTTKQVVSKINKLEKRWKKEFVLLSLYLTVKFVDQIEKHCTRQIGQALSKKGYQIKFRKTRELTRILNLIKAENKSLIQSLESQYFTRVKSILYEAIVREHTADSLVLKLTKQLGITERRAKRIVEGQVNRATSSIIIERATEAGFSKGRWIHSHQDKKPRPKHLKAHGKIFDLKVGLPIGDQGQNVRPAEENGCTCRFSLALK